MSRRTAYHSKNRRQRRNYGPDKPYVVGGEKARSLASQASPASKDSAKKYGATLNANALTFSSLKIFADHAFLIFKSLGLNRILNFLHFPCNDGTQKYN